MERYNINVTIRHGDSNSRYNRESVEALRLALIIDLLGKENAKRILEYIEVNNLQIDDVYKYIRQVVNEDNTEYTELLTELLNDSDSNFEDYRTLSICLTHICMSVMLQNEDIHAYIAYEANDGENYSTRSLGSTFTDGEYLNRLVGEIFKQYQGESLLNADCGIGSFLIFEKARKSEKEIGGLCINRKAYNIARARAQVLGNEIFHIQQKGLFQSNEKVYDKVYVTYPISLDYDIKEVTPTIFSLECAKFLELGRKYSSSMLGIVSMLKCLKEDGVMIAVVPDGGLKNNIDTDIRKYLIHSNYVDTIISLPNSILYPNANIAASLVILRKNRQLEEPIVFINAEKIISTKYFGRILDRGISKVINILNKKDNDLNKYIVKRSDIVTENYFLGIQRYMEPKSGFINPKELNTVCNGIIRGCQISSKTLDEFITENITITNYRLINISDIAAEGYVKSNLTPVQIDDPKKFDKFCLEPGDLVITAKNTTFKSAVYEQEDDIKAIMTGNLVAIRLDQKKMNPYFLKAFLDSNVGQNVLASVQTGTTLKTLTVNNLAVMRVSCPFMETQEKIAAAYKSKLSEVKEYIAKYEKAVDDLKNIYQKEV